MSIYREVIYGSPGTGKTRYLTEVITDAVYSGVNPEDIVALSFSNAAAKELAGRNKGILCSTIHSYANVLLKASGDERVVFKDSDRDEWIKLMSNHYLDGLVTKSIDAYDLARSTMDSSLIIEDYKSIILKYETHKAKVRAIDFCDMLYNVKPSTPGEILVVDEGQDLTAAQWRAIAIWSKAFKKVYVCGDPDQAIYRFAGASAMAKMSISDSTKVVNLSQGWRMPDKIHKFCVNIAKHNKDSTLHNREYKAMKTGGCITYQNLQSASDRLPVYFNTLFNRLIAEDEDCLILSRTNREAHLMADMLDDIGISYHGATINKNSNMLDNRMWRIDEIDAFRRMMWYFEQGRDVPPSDARAMEAIFPKEFLIAALRPNKFTFLHLAERLSAKSQRIIRRLMTRYDDDIHAAYNSKIKLSTFHGSKGLENQNVYVWLRYSQAMLSRVAKDGNILSEETSCIYVACSRSLANLELIKCGRNPLTHKASGF